MNFNDRIAADYLVRVDISTLYKFGAHSGGGFGWESSIEVEVSTWNPERYFIRLKYREFEYDVPLITTPCNYGGTRYWFECLFCQRRVGVLYLRADIFACRHCQFLTYESKLVSGHLKRIGRIISLPELEEAENKVKRIYYNGKPTKNYIRFLSKERKFATAFGGHTDAIKKRSERRSMN